MKSGNISALVVMGVAGCGKTSVAQAIVARLGGCLIEGDAFHPQVNVDKMRRGIALTDQDRRGWLDRLVQELAAAQQGGDHAVLACSALKRRYRDRLRAGGACLGFVFLQLPEAEALSRVAQRVGHFMPDSLVASQFADLEPPSAEALVLTVDATLPVQAIAEQVAHWYARIQSGGNKSD